MTELGRILIAEDDSNDVELTLSALGRHTLANEVVVVRDGEQTLDYLYRRNLFATRAEGNPVVALIDLKMPKLDGIQVIRQIKSDPFTKTIPVVVLTSSGESRDLQECYELGVNAYVVKPVQFTAFIEAVRQIGAFWAIINCPPPRSIR